MRYGIIADVHGNYEALKKALEVLSNENAEFIYSAGDIVGYGAEPEECVREIRKYAIQSVMGNHDFAVNSIEEEEQFNAYARLAIQWTRSKLSINSRNFLKGLPFFIENGSFTIFHGTLDAEEMFNYILMPEDATLSFKNMKTKIGFFGHSHIAGYFTLNENGLINYRSAYSDCSIILEKENKYLVNVGSVGQPRDGNPMGALAIYDTENSKVEIKRFEYDIEVAAQKIIEAGLPRFLAERLYSGV